MSLYNFKMYMQNGFLVSTEGNQMIPNIVLFHYFASRSLIVRFPYYIECLFIGEVQLDKTLLLVELLEKEVSYKEQKMFGK